MPLLTEEKSAITHWDDMARMFHRPSRRVQECTCDATAFLKTAVADDALWDYDPLAALFDAEALCIFVASNKSIRSLWREPNRTIELKMGENEIQELHAKEVGVGNPSEERASS